MEKKTLAIITAILFLAAFVAGVIYNKHLTIINAPVEQTKTPTTPPPTNLPLSLFISPAGNEVLKPNRVYLIKWNGIKAEGNYFLFDSVLQGDGWHIAQNAGKLGPVDLLGGQFVWQMGNNSNLGVHKLILADTSDIDKISVSTKFESNIFCLEPNTDSYDSFCKKILQDYQTSATSTNSSFSLGAKDPSNLSQSHIDSFGGVIKGWAYDANQFMKIVITLVNNDDPQDTFTYVIDTHENQSSQYVLTERADIEDYLKKQGAQNTGNLANFLLSSGQFLHPGNWKILSATFNGKPFGIPPEASGIYNQQ